MIRKNYNAASEELKRQKKRDINKNKRKQQQQQQQKPHNKAPLTSTTRGPRSSDPKVNTYSNGSSSNTGSHHNNNNNSNSDRNDRKSKVHQRQPINDLRKLGPKSVYFDPEFNPAGQAPPGWKNYSYPLKYPYSGYVVLSDVKEIALPEEPVPKYFKFYHSQSSGGSGSSSGVVGAAETGGASGGNVTHNSQVTFEAEENVVDPSAQAVSSGLVPTALLRKNKKQKQQQQQQSGKKRTSEQAEQLGASSANANDGAKKVRLETVEDDGFL